VASNPSIKAVVLTAAHTAADILPAFQAGACGFLRQDIPSKQLIKSLELVALGQSALERTIVFASRGGEEMSDPHIHSHHRRIRRGLKRNFLLVGKREPPAIWLAGEGDTAVDPLAIEHVLMIGCQADRQEDGLPLL
jgi:hypothetical protein